MKLTIAQLQGPVFDAPVKDTHICEVHGKMREFIA